MRALIGGGVACLLVLAACGGSAGDVTDGAVEGIEGIEDVEDADDAGDADEGVSTTITTLAAETTTGPEPATAEFLSSLDGVIVFSSERDDVGDDSSDDLYAMAPDGSSVSRLTDTDRNEWWPEISSDGTTLIFGRNYDPDENRTPPSGHSAWGVFVWESGSDPVDVTDNAHFQASPRMSPDGSWLLFTSSRGSRASTDDGGLYTLGETNVWVMAPDGSDQVQLSDNDGAAASWSPDGSKIVFSGVADGGESRDIFIMNADGTGLQQVTDDESNEARPDWSPDGTRIVFDSDRDGDREIFVIDVDGAGASRQLTDNDDRDDFARWSPDGDAIVFTTDRDGNREIYVMDSDGGKQTNVSNNDALDTLPSWSPVPFEGAP